MRIEDALPALRAGRKARRAVWRAGSYVKVDEIAGVRNDHFTMKDGASESTWPGSQLQARDMLADDWELLALPEHQAYVPYNFREALDMVMSVLSAETFSPQTEMRERERRKRSFAKEGPETPDCDWRTMGRSCVDRYFEASYADGKEGVRAALVSACIDSLKALSYHLAEDYVKDVMGW